MYIHVPQIFAQLYASEDIRYHHRPVWCRCPCYLLPPGCVHQCPAYGLHPPPVWTRPVTSLNNYNRPTTSSPVGWRHPTHQQQQQPPAATTTTTAVSRLCVAQLITEFAAINWLSPARKQKQRSGANDGRSHTQICPH